MDPQPESSLPVSVPPPPPSRLHTIFMGPNGIRAGWRFLIFLVIFGVLQNLFRLAIVRIPYVQGVFKEVQSGTLTPAFGLIFESSFVVIIFLATFIMSRIERRSVFSYGLPFRGAFGKLFWQGALWGLVMEAAVMLLIYAFGGFTFGGLALAGGALFGFAQLWALNFILVGIAEEFTFRGYAQFTLTTGVGFWPAALITSAIFGAIHLGNPGEGWIGAVEVFIFGMFACFTLRRTGNLWFAVGFHAAGDYAETFLFSVPDSGMLAKGHLINSSLHGSKWLTGGTIGPEGSLIDLALFAVVFVLFALVYRKKDQTTAPAIPSSIAV